MDPFECYIYEEATGHETGFTISQYQEYSILINNIQMLGNLIYNYKLELKRDPRKTTKTAEPPQGDKFSLKFVMIRCAYEMK